MTSSLLGGSWYEGAMAGMSIGAFNHEGKVITHNDGTLEAVEPLPEVVVVGRPKIIIPQILHEKPLELIHPEFGILFTAHGLYSIIKNLNPSFRKSFFDGAMYHNRIIDVKSKDLYHRFPRSVDAFESEGKRSMITGGDGNIYERLEIPGEYGQNKGVFEYIKDSKGVIRHRFFRPK
ncbi:MAG: putative MafB-like protein [bacterium F083]|nr:MAG: putative MafB-like protein [bacterium F083]